MKKQNFMTVGLIVLTVALNACARREIKTPIRGSVTSQTSNSVNAQMELSYKSGQTLSPEIDSAIKALSENKTSVSSYGAITQALLRSQWDAYYANRKDRINRTMEQLEELIQKQADESNGAVKVSSDNSNYLQVLEPITRAPFFNPDSNNIVDVFETGSYNRFSLTVLHQLILRNLLTPEQFAQTHSVVIYDQTHVLPGYLREVDGEWKLFGLNYVSEDSATLSDSAQVHGNVREYGSLRLLDSKVEIMDASTFATIEATRTALVDYNQARQQAIDKTFKAYGVILPKTP